MQSAVQAAVPGEWFQIALALAHSNQLVGDVGVCIGKDGRAAELGFTLARAHQKFGYAAEGVRCAVDLLFAEPAIGCVTAVTDARNLSARKLLDRLGFLHTATSNRLFKGAQCAEHTFEIKRAAWRVLPNSSQPGRPPD
jgi:RimJ/RimL family protein N-acetyltransferase